MKKAFSLIELSIVILIIGILIAGVTQGSRLVSQMRLSTARTLTQSSPIASITGLVTWIESTSEKSFDSADQNDGVGITNWYDLNPTSIAKVNFSQATPANRPTYRTNYFNGLPAIYFDGVSDSMASAAINASEVSLTGTITAFMVTKIRGGVLAFKFDTGSDRFGIERQGNNTLRFDYPNATNGLLGGAGVITNTTNVFTFNHNGSTQTIYSNGASYASQANTDTFSTNFSSTLTLGAQTGGASFFGELDIAEFIIYNRSLKTEERKSIEKYLGQKWGIKVL